MSESCNDLCSVIDSPSSSEESCPLLLPSAVTGESPSAQQFSCQQLTSICPPSKAASVLACLAVVIGAVHAIFTCIFVLVAIFVVGEHINESLAITLSYLAMVIGVVLYPISGFLADVMFGRYRMIVVSVCSIVISFVFIFGAITVISLVYLSPHSYLFSQKQIIVLIILAILFCLTFGIGVVAYHANFIQFGLDQLMDMPSKSLSLMIHWMIWADNFGFAQIILLASTTLCCDRVAPATAATGVSILCFILLNLFLIILCRKRRWFHTEPRQHNPYKEVIKVLNFVRKHKYPVQCSAFTYCDDERPLRLDFAKERFGGPFSTEQVENVKTFLQIFVVLFAVGSVFVLEVSSSPFGFPLISTHIAFNGTNFCKIQWIFIESGTLRYVTSAMFIPIYICILHKRKKIPRIFTRIGIEIFVYLIGSLTILLVDISGHAKNGNGSGSCMMNVTFYPKSSTWLIPRLGMHWGTLIPPNIFLGIGPLLVFISTLEFISAQSPSTMKGLVVGLCFTINRLFQLLGSVALIPFSKEVWQSKEHPSIISCGFGYLSCVLVIALIGFILFLVVAKRYKFRERDDRPYDQRFVISVYDKYLNQVDT